MEFVEQLQEGFDEFKEKAAMGTAVAYREHLWWTV